MAETRKVLISISNMKKYFPLKKSNPLQREKLYVKANDGIDLKIYEGETFGLVGESGCGKSTLGRVLLQLHSQTDGRTMYYGRERGEIAPKYVETLLKNLYKNVRLWRKLDAEKKKVLAEYNALRDERARWAMDERRREAIKKADDLYGDIVKIIGGCIAVNDPAKYKEVAAAFLADYFADVDAAKCRAARVVLENELEALEAGDKRASEGKIAALRAKLAENQAKQREVDAKLRQTDAALEALRAKYRSLPGFAENEKLLDNGIDLSKLTSEEMRLLRKDMQLIFQDPYSSLNPRMTVSQLIGEGLMAHNMFHRNSPQMQDYVLKVMEQCGLAPYMMHRYPHQFSGGQRQRIGIARSLALQPKFIVCDEAVSALDVSIQSQILNLLLDLKEQEHFTYLFISHDLSVIKYISDRIGVMYLGNMVEMAPSDELFAHPTHPYTEALLAAIPTTDVDASRDMVPIEGDIPSPIKPPSGCKFHTRCKYCQDICKQVVPEYREIAPEHFVACHLKS